MEDILARTGVDLLGRLTGPLEFRLYLQPAVAVIYAFRDGRRDTIAGRTPYLRELITNPRQRVELLNEGWKSVSRVFLLAVIIDITYQHLALPRIYPGEAMITSFTLAVIPYLLLRGPVNRIWRRRHDHKVNSRSGDEKKS
jgi:hypothetical protein